MDLKNEYGKSFTELSEIISVMEKPMQAKIPKALIEQINKYKDDSYKFEFYEGVRILPETQALLSVLLSEYIGSEEIKKRFREYDKYYDSLKEDEKNRKYKKDLFNFEDNVDELSEPSVSADNQSEIEDFHPTQNKQSSIVKILNKIKSIFKK